MDVDYCGHGRMQQCLAMVATSLPSVSGDAVAWAVHAARLSKSNVKRALVNVQVGGRRPVLAALTLYAAV